VHDWQRDRVGSVETGTNPMVIAQMDSGYAVTCVIKYTDKHVIRYAGTHVTGELDNWLRERLNNRVSA